MPTYNWKELLAQWSKDILASDECAQALPAEVRASGWLGYPGATEAQIAQAEARLKAKLPLSYREFLKVTNGWRTTTLSIDRLWSTEEIEWFSVRHQDWIDAWSLGWSLGAGPDEVPIPDEEYLVYGEGQTGALRTEYLQTALEISDFGDGIYLLNPRIVTEEGEWEAWFFADWLPGARRYRSFWELMQAERQIFLLLKEHEGKRVLPGESPHMLAVKLPRLIEELQRKAQMYNGLASKQTKGPSAETAALHHQGMAEGLRFAETRVREIQTQAQQPQELRKQLNALADELESKCQQETSAAKKTLDLDALLLGGIDELLLKALADELESKCQQETSAAEETLNLGALLLEGMDGLLGQLQAFAVLEGYRQAAGIIRWFLNEQ
jgi:hypothetical protein